MDIFNAKEFMWRLDCGEWRRTWMTIYIVSNASITWMFVLIGVTFAYLSIKIRKRGLAILVSLQAAEKARRAGGLMCAVFVLCAGGHLIENVGAFGGQLIISSRCGIWPRWSPLRWPQPRFPSGASTCCGRKEQNAF